MKMSTSKLLALGGLCALFAGVGTAAVAQDNDHRDRDDGRAYARHTDHPGARSGDHRFGADWHGRPGAVGRSHQERRTERRTDRRRFRADYRRDYRYAEAMRRSHHRDRDDRGSR